MVDILRQKVNGTIPKNEIDTTGMKGFETKVRTPVIPPTASPSRQISRASIDIHRVDRAYHPAEIAPMDPTSSRRNGTIRTYLSHKNGIRQTI